MKAIRLRRPYFPENSIKKIQRDIGNAMRDGRLSIGKNVTKFEKKFAKFNGSKFGCGVSSATAGLHIALLSLGIKQNDENIKLGFFRRLIGMVNVFSDDIISTS